MNSNNKQKTVLLGLSGGVDSSVAALVLKKQGYKVIGAFMKCYSDSKNKFTGQCNWIAERQMAQKIALQLNIPLVTLDFENEYKKDVIDPMIKDYQKGLTPNPDIACNTIIKFPLLWKEAKKLKADFIATGHYARIKKGKNSFHLLTGKDKTKDQSYFLSELTQNDLEHTLFPLGNFTKEKVRQIARENHFPNSDKHGTTGICFIGKMDFKSFLEKKIKTKPGKVLNPENKVIGTHPGAEYFTIGQKIGPHIGINIDKGKYAQSRWYLAKKRGNTLIVAPERNLILKKREVQIIKMKRINPKENIPNQLKARIRHLGRLIPGSLKGNTFTFNKPQEGIAPGQFIVLYHKDQLIASGQIRLK